MRSRTRAGRLAALDSWLVHERAAALSAPALVLDVGFGLAPVTTEELALAVRAVQPAARVVGVERDAARVVPGRAVEVVQGDFTTLASLGPASVVRAMNVLRGYREEEVPAIHGALGAALAEGGVLLEGSTDVEGHVTAAWIFSKRGGAVVREALLFHTDFSRGFSPWLFRDVLPRDVRRRVKPGEPVHGFLAAWATAADEGGAGRSPAERFTSSLGGVDGLEATDWERAHGFARWRKAGGFGEAR